MVRCERAFALLAASRNETERDEGKNDPDGIPDLTSFDRPPIALEHE
jgi:hypothetical protein